jgi:N-dimethylarginine dimethylaminohydrolase
MRRVLFCPPEHFDVIDVKNPFMRGAAPVDRTRARRQWEAVCSAFAEAGHDVVTLPAAAGLEDMVFANNPVFVGWSAAGGFVVPSRMRYPSRQGEVEHYVRWFREYGFGVVELEYGADDYLEGHGDLLWHADRSKVWAGHGFRSSRGGVRKFEEAMDELGIHVIPLELADERFYHLDTCLAPLTAEAVLVYPGAFTHDAYERIQENCARVYEVAAEDALGFVCNGVATGGRFITAQMTPRLANALEREGLEPLLVDTSEFEKSGGSVCCLKLFVD